MIGCWADRFGALLDGWFYDGCACLNLTEEDLDRWYATSRRSNPNAAVAFNNAGYDMEVEAAISSRDDYFAGEATLLKEGLPLQGWREPENAYPSGQWSRGGETFAVGEGFCPHSRFVPGNERMLWHVLTPIDAFWYHGGNVDWLQNQPYSRYLNPATLPPGEMEPPLYSDRELRTLLDGFRSAGAAVTLNVAIRMNGSFGERTVEQLQRLRRTDPIPSSIATPEKENKEKCQ
ncbi:hypothetical protein SDC9_157652 [bioreactor metagenome]|uniref:Uncharacterized protein n=1 Tax=bioreactor metagenome TaxID=1076179 RepID=A0A645F802_9ZZZZ